MADAIRDENSSEKEVVPATEKRSVMTLEGQGDETDVAANDERAADEHVNVASGFEYYYDCPSCPAMSIRDAFDPERKKAHDQVHKMLTTEQMQERVLLVKDTDDAPKDGGGDATLPSNDPGDGNDLIVQKPSSPTEEVKDGSETDSVDSSPPAGVEQIVRPKVGGGKPGAFDLRMKMYGPKRFETALADNWSYPEEEPVEEEVNSGKAQCDICSKMICKKGLARHKRTHLKNRTMYECPQFDVCGKLFYSPSTLRRHLKEAIVHNNGK